MTEKMIDVDAILKMFSTGQLKGNSIVAMAIIYEEALLLPPNANELAQALVRQFKQSGKIDSNILLTPSTRITMREMASDELSEFPDCVGSSIKGEDFSAVNNALASMLAEQDAGYQDMNDFTAVSLKSYSDDLWTIWFALIAN